jgi:alkylhydroperoxidase family enzyme
MKYHTAVAVELMQDGVPVTSALHNIDTCSLSASEKVLLQFVDKVNHHSPSIRAYDIQALHAVGWSDAAIYDAITVCALFNFYNRWIDANGVHPMSDEAHQKFGLGTAQNGYIHRPLGENDD